MPRISAVDFIILLFTVLGIFVTLISISSSLTKEIRQDLFKKYYFKSKLIIYFLIWISISFLFSIIISLLYPSSSQKVNFLLLSITFIWSLIFITTFILRLNRDWFYEELLKKFKNEIKGQTKKSIDDQKTSKSSVKVFNDFLENLSYLRSFSQDFTKESDFLKKIIIYSIENKRLYIIQDFFLEFFGKKPNDFALNDQLISMFHDLRLKHWENIGYVKTYQEYLVELVYKQLLDNKSYNRHRIYALYIKKCIDYRTMKDLKNRDEEYIASYDLLLGRSIDHLYRICIYILKNDIPENKEYLYLEEYMKSLCQVLDGLSLNCYDYRSAYYKMIEEQKEYLRSKELNLIFIILFLINNQKLKKSFFELAVKLYKIEVDIAPFYRFCDGDFELIELCSNNLKVVSDVSPFEYNRYRLVLLFYEFVNNPNFEIAKYLNSFNKEDFLGNNFQILNDSSSKITIKFYNKYFDFEEDKFSEFIELLKKKVEEKENDIKKRKIEYITETELVPKNVQKFQKDYRENWENESDKLKDFIKISEIKISDSSKDVKSLITVLDKEKEYFMKPYSDNISYVKNFGKIYGKRHAEWKYLNIIMNIYSLAEDEVIIKDIYSDLSDLVAENGSEYFLFLKNLNLIRNIPNLQWINSGYVRARATIKESVINFCYGNIPIILFIEKESFILNKVPVNDKNEFLSIKIKKEKVNVTIEIEEKFEIIKNTKLKKTILKKLKF